MPSKKINRVIEPVIVTQEDANSPFDGSTYSHPSYGQARFSRTSGERGKLYGSKVDSSNAIELTISTSKCRQDLGRDWYREEDQIVQVIFTQTQFAELLTNMNASGVPCTISYREALGSIEFAEMPRELEYIKEEIQRKKDTQKAELTVLQKESNELLTKTGTLRKADKERLIRINQLIVNLSSSSLPFYAKSAEETIEKATQEAKAEIEAFNLHAVTALGLKALEDIDVVKHLLENKSN
jgi:folate-dependent phosphoribosylglycinamide formyltransferase PurN